MVTGRKVDGLATGVHYLTEEEPRALMDGSLFVPTDPGTEAGDRLTKMHVAGREFRGKTQTLIRKAPVTNLHRTPCRWKPEQTKHREFRLDAETDHPDDDSLDEDEGAATRASLGNL